MTNLESKHYNGSEPRASASKINYEFDNSRRDYVKGKTVKGKITD